MTMEPAKIRSHQRLALRGTALLALVLTAVQMGFYLFGYEFDTDLYVQGPLPIITAILWSLVAAAVCLVSIPLPGKVICDELKISPSVFTDIASLLSVASLVGSLVATAMLRQSPVDPLGRLLSSTQSTDASARILLLFSLAFTIPAALHFTLQFAFHRIYPLGTSAAIFWVGFTTLRVYFDMRLMLMSPRRILHLVALICALLFLLAELRLARGIGTRRFYTLTAGLTLALTGCNALTNLFLSIIGKLSPGSEICTYFFQLCIALYAASRLHSLCKVPPIPKTAVSADIAPSDTLIQTPDAADELSETADELPDDAPTAQNEADDIPDFNMISEEAPPSTKHLPLDSTDHGEASPQ